MFGVEVRCPSSNFASIMLLRSDDTEKSSSEKIFKTNIDGSMAYF